MQAVDKAPPLCPLLSSMPGTAYAVCRLYSAANSRSDLRILHMMMAANTRTAIRPGTKAVPREPVVTSVPTWYTAKATV